MRLDAEQLKQLLAIVRDAKRQCDAFGRTFDDALERELEDELERTAEPDKAQSLIASFYGPSPGRAGSGS